MLKRSTFRICLAAVTVACGGGVDAAPLSVAFENFTYSGTVTRYATLANAQDRLNSTGGPYTIQTAVDGTRQTRPNARDGQISVNSETPVAYGTPLTYLSTVWYFTTTPASGDGWGNPNNTNEGFIQYYLNSNPTVTGGWRPGYTQFQLGVAGGNGDDLDAARLWPAPDSGASAISSGTFVEFNLNVSAAFSTPAVLNTTTNWYETNAMPSSVTGTINGIFLNQGSDLAYHGYYVFNFNISGPGSWAEDSRATWSGGTSPTSRWAAPAAAAPATGAVAAVPTLNEITLTLLGLLLAGWGMRGLRLRQG